MILAAIRPLGRRSGGRVVPASEAYRPLANRCAELAIACSAPSVAAALLALALGYMALADKSGQLAVPTEDQRQEIQEETGFGD
jgi:hypothetical protein